MTTFVNIHDAKSQLSKLIARAEAGEVVTIARAGVPVADLVMHQNEVTGRRHIHGIWTGQVDLTEFDAVDEEIEREFGSD